MRFHRGVVLSLTWGNVIVQLLPATASSISFSNFFKRSKSGKVAIAPSLTSGKEITDAIIPQKLSTKGNTSGGSKILPVSESISGTDTSSSAASSVWGRRSGDSFCEIRRFSIPGIPKFKPPAGLANLELTAAHVNWFIKRKVWSKQDPSGGESGIPEMRALPNKNLWLVPQEDIPVGVIPDAQDRNTGVNGIGRIKMSEAPIGSGKYTAVYALVSPPSVANMAIKYQIFCGTGMDKSEPIVREAFFLKLLENESISHKLVYLSGPIRFHEVQGNGAKFRKLHPTQCKVHDDEEDPAPKDEGRIRYMITEITGQNLADYAHVHFSDPLIVQVNRSISNIFKLTAQMILLLKQLHSRNIVHGDAHWGNFVFKTTGSYPELIVMDFGRAQFIDLEAYKKLVNDRLEQGDVDDPRIDGYDGVWNNEDETFLLFHHSVSMWETYFALPSFRDDVYRVIQSLAHMLHGNHYFGCLVSLTTMDRDKLEQYGAQSEYYKFKHTRNIFETVITCEDYESNEVQKHEFHLDNVFFPSHVDEGRMRLSRILYLVRSTKIFERPAYDAILNELVQLIELTSEYKSSDSEKSLKDIISLA